MNAQIANLNPLSPALKSPFQANLNRPARRHFIGSFLIQAEGLAWFNQLLARLQHFPLHPDQLASAARDVAAAPKDGQRVAAIGERLQRIDAIRRMVADPAWQPASHVAIPARLVADYAAQPRHLIPRDLPDVAGLDEAIVLDAAWPRLADEVDDYLDFCRLRSVEAHLRGVEVADLPFSRDDWKEARRAEAGLIARARRSATGSYLPSSAPARFRVC